MLLLFGGCSCGSRLGLLSLCGGRLGGGLGSYWLNWSSFCGNWCSNRSFFSGLCNLGSSLSLLDGRSGSGEVVLLLLFTGALELLDEGTKDGSTLGWLGLLLGSLCWSFLLLGLLYWSSNIGSGSNGWSVSDFSLELFAWLGNICCDDGGGSRDCFC